MAEIEPWIQLVSGVAFDLLTPAAEQVSLFDIAYALSRLARYNGHTIGPLPRNVAQHSLLVESILPEEADPYLRLHALLHDAHEAYIGDLPTPLKTALNRLSRYSFGTNWITLTGLIDAVIWQAFALKPPTDEQAKAIKLADYQALFLERDAFMAVPRRDWGLTEPPEGIPNPDIMQSFEPKMPDDAKDEFIKRVRLLMDMRHGIA